VLPDSFAGRSFDRELLAVLPDGVDWCGENGESHTFAWGGPMFRHLLKVQPGERVARDGFVCADLLLSSPAGGHHYASRIFRVTAGVVSERCSFVTTMDGLRADQEAP